MKKFAILPVAGLFAGLLAVMPSEANANDYAKICNAVRKADPQGFDAKFENLGECVSKPTELCKVLEYPYVGQFANLKNKGECVSFLRHLDFGS